MSGRQSLKTVATSRSPDSERASFIFTCAALARVARVRRPRSVTGSKTCSSTSVLTCSRSSLFNLRESFNRTPLRRGSSFRPTGITRFRWFNCSTALDQLFDKARTHNKWQSREVPDELLKAIVEHMKWGPTSANCSPARIVFVKSQEAKARLKPHLSPGNVEKTMAAPATAILAYDLRFYDYLPQLQGGYFILATRALGLDCGPMSGFNNAGVDAEFFPGTDIKSSFLCNLAYGDQSGVYPRSPRFSFDEMARII